eukprot:gene10186-2605_t
MSMLDIVEEKVQRRNLKTGLRENVTVQYKKGKLLGKGGFAKCFEFLNLKSRETVAIKVVDKTNLKPKTKQKLTSEIKIHKSLKHKNIVEFKSFFEDSHFVYITLEICHCNSMMELMKNKRRLSNDESKFFILQLLEGVDFMHKQNVIHRDLKLGNIFLTNQMEIKIGDFGLASKLDFTGQRKKTLCGTPNYIAPEILKNEGHGTEVDVWSIGVIIYTLLVGTPPFETQNVKTTYQKIKDLDFEFPPNISISESAKDLVKRILTLDPSKRPSIDEIKQHSWLRDTVLNCPESLYKYAEKYGNAMRPPLAPVQNRRREQIDQDALLKKRKILTPMQISPDNKKRKTEDYDAPSCTIPSPKKKIIKDDNDQENLIKNESTNFKPFPIKLDHDIVVDPLREIETLKESKETIFISKWYDFSNKYGFAYQFNNGITGAHFNDCSKIIWDKKYDNVEYIEKEIIEKFKMSENPIHLKKKISLIKYFEQFLNSHENTKLSPLLKMNEIDGIKLNNEYHHHSLDSIYVKRWISTKHAIIMRFNDRSVQSCFNDNTQLILSNDMKNKCKIIQIFQKD